MMTPEETALRAQLTTLDAARDALLATLRAQSAAAKDAQATAGNEINPALAEAQATYDEVHALSDEGEVIRHGALAEAAADIPEIGPIAPAPPDQSGTISGIGS